MKIKINTVIKTPLLLSVLLLCSFVAQAENLNLADKPLAAETEGVAPNIMLILDDSGSMSCGSGGRCADDVFYAPGFDANKEYRCTNISQVLKPLQGNTVVVHVSDNSGTQGTPYFSYAGKYYTWGDNDPTTPINGNSFEGQVCFDPDEKYQVRLHAYTAESACLQYETVQQYVGWREKCENGSYSSINSRCSWWQRTGDYINVYKDVEQCKVESKLLTAKNAKEETMDGNFLNWYFSATIAEWADDTVTGGFKDYGTVGKNHGYWTEIAATDFVTEDVTFCYRGSGSTANNCNTTSGLSNGYVAPERTMLNGSDKNANNKTWFPPLPTYTSGSYTGQANSWSSNGAHYVYDTSSAHYHSSDPSINLIGLKPGVSYNQMRVQVSIDVGKKVVRDLDKAFMSVADFHGKINSSYQLSQPSYQSASRYLLHGFAEINTQDKPTLSETNKDSLIKVINATGAGGGTPTATALTAAARYFLTGWDETQFTFKEKNKTDKTVKIEDVLDRTFRNSTDSNMAGYTGTAKHITAENWCQKNAVAILTDGQPSNESSLSSTLNSYIPEGVLSVKNVDQQKLIRVAGALYDQDFLPNIQGKQNIETFVIAMGDDSVIDDENFIDVGRAGGGGVNNFYKGSDGAAIAQAFKDIIARIQAASASVTAIAVSAVSELRADNFAIQATYQTEYWTSELKALRLNQKGQFINPSDDVTDENLGTDSSAGKTPVWEANAALNSKYIIDSSAKKLVNTRKVYTWNGSQGVRFGSDSMTRPSSTTATFSAFTNLPTNMQNDLKMRAGANTQEQYDLMMYLLGDIKHEEGHEIPGGTEKYRRRGVYQVNAENKVETVSKGGFLGDIASSSPIYVKEPPRPWDDKSYGTLSKPYSVYKEEQADRTAMVYVGTNRGFLHGIAVEGSDAGTEVFAYMPNALSSIAPQKGYHYLASKNYEHRFYVDLTPTVSDVFMDFYTDSNDAKNAEWRTILVGGLRAGGMGYFALDVTCPYKTSNSSTCDNESFDEKNVLWEFTDIDDPDLGFTFAEPVISRVFYDTGASDTGRHGEEKGRWAAIVSNGYNSLNGRAVLFILFLDGGLDGTWTEGVDYVKLYAGNATDDTPTNKNGLSSATVIDLDGDGIVDHIYAGDLKGQMWSFDVTQSVVYQEATP